MWAFDFFDGLHSIDNVGYNQFIRFDLGDGAVTGFNKPLDTLISNELAQVPLRIPTWF
jgi:hypothetical protein